MRPSCAYDHAKKDSPPAIKGRRSAERRMSLRIEDNEIAWSCGHIAKDRDARVKPRMTAQERKRWGRPGLLPAGPVSPAGCASDGRELLFS